MLILLINFAVIPRNSTIYQSEVLLKFLRIFNETFFKEPPGKTTSNTAWLLGSLRKMPHIKSTEFVVPFPGALTAWAWVTRAPPYI
jgi:hypothetical protein